MNLFIYIILKVILIEDYYELIRFIIIPVQVYKA